MLSRVILSAILVAATAGLARAGATTPTLIVQSANVIGPLDGGAGPLANFTVVYDHSNAVQADYDIELIVFQGPAFARFPISGAVRTGTSTALDDGLALSDLPALEAASAPAPPAVRVVTIEPTRIGVALPATFDTGNAIAVLVATVDEGTILSNPLMFGLP